MRRAKYGVRELVGLNRLIDGLLKLSMDGYFDGDFLCRMKAISLSFIPEIDMT